MKYGFWNQPHRILQPRFLGDAGDAGGTGSGSGTPSTGDAGTPTAPPKPGTAEETFTQAQVESMIKDRFKKHVKPEDLGFESKAEMDRFVKAARDREEADKDEQQKAIDKARKEGRTEAETELLGKANARMIRGEFIAAAQAKNVVSPQDAYLIAQSEGRFTDVTITDADEVQGLDDSWWEALLKDRPYLTQAADNGNQGGSNGATQRQTPTPGDANAGTRGSTRVPEDRQKELEHRYPSLQRRR